jgi:hypothetical protein
LEEIIMLAGVIAAGNMTLDYLYGSFHGKE